MQPRFICERAHHAESNRGGHDRGGRWHTDGCRTDLPAIRRAADYVELTKPRIAVMALFTVAIGYLLASAPHVDVVILFNTLLGAGLVAAGGSALNQCLERRSDARMLRTANRPLPAGRMSTAEATTFGVVLSLAGLIYLVVTIPHLAAAATAALTVFIYVCIYTPLKRITVWNTVIGAVPGRCRR